MAELDPLSKKEFETLYDKAWENGWVYGKFFQELYDEYLVNWVYFIVYLDNLKMTKPQEIEILIGEAPPYWKGNAKNKDKSYFYNPSQTNSSSWLNAPAAWKFGGKFKAKANDLKDLKIEKLRSGIIPKIEELRSGHKSKTKSKTKEAEDTAAAIAASAASIKAKKRLMDIMEMPL